MQMENKITSGPTEWKMIYYCRVRKLKKCHSLFYAFVQKMALHFQQFSEHLQEDLLRLDTPNVSWKETLFHSSNSLYCSSSSGRQ